MSQAFLTGPSSIKDIAGSAVSGGSVSIVEKTYTSYGTYRISVSNPKFFIGKMLLNKTYRWPYTPSNPNNTMGEFSNQETTAAGFVPASKIFTLPSIPGLTDDDKSKSTTINMMEFTTSALVFQFPRYSITVSGSSYGVHTYTTTFTEFSISGIIISA